MTKISTGVDFLDSFLGKYEGLVNIYGPAGAGKTLLCKLITIKTEKRIIFIDSEVGFSVERLRQLTPDYKNVLEKLIILKPKSFFEQKQLIESLDKMVNKSTDAVIVDTLTRFYRIEMAKTNDTNMINSVLKKQMTILKELSERIPVIITNQVYSNQKTKDEVSVVGGEFVRNKSDYIIELKKFRTYRKLIVHKPENLENKELVFKIEEKGISEIK
jgi:DNA repair protein RadB